MKQDSLFCRKKIDKSQQSLHYYGSQFKASLVYKVRSRTAKDLQQNPDWKNQRLKVKLKEIEKKAT